MPPHVLVIASKYSPKRHPQTYKSFRSNSLPSLITLSARSTSIRTSKASPRGKFLQVVALHRFLTHKHAPSTILRHVQHRRNFCLTNHASRRLSSAHTLSDCLSISLDWSLRGIHQPVCDACHSTSLLQLSAFCDLGSHFPSATILWLALLVGEILLFKGWQFLIFLAVRPHSEEFNQGHCCAHQTHYH